jgi:hypothetical protein
VSRRRGANNRGPEVTPHSATHFRSANYDYRSAPHSLSAHPSNRVRSQPPQSPSSVDLHERPWRQPHSPVHPALFPSYPTSSSYPPGNSQTYSAYPYLHPPDFPSAPTLSGNSSIPFNSQPASLPHPPPGTSQPTNNYDVFQPTTHFSRHTPVDNLTIPLVTHPDFGLMGPYPRNEYLRANDFGEKNHHGFPLSRINRSILGNQGQTLHLNYSPWEEGGTKWQNPLQIPGGATEDLGAVEEVSAQDSVVPFRSVMEATYVHPTSLLLMYPPITPRNASSQGARPNPSAVHKRLRSGRAGKVQCPRCRTAKKGEDVFNFLVCADLECIPHETDIDRRCVRCVKLQKCCGDRALPPARLEALRRAAHYGMRGPLKNWVQKTSPEDVSLVVSTSGDPVFAAEIAKIRKSQEVDCFARYHNMQRFSLTK